SFFWQRVGLPHSLYLTTGRESGRKERGWAMARKKVEDIVEELAVPVVEELSFELVDVEYLKEGANSYLMIYIDKQGGVTIDDWQAMSERMSNILEREDPIKQSYILEVSSPGERPLKKDRDFERFRGEFVEVRLYQPLNGKKIYEGELLGLNGDIVE